MTMTIMIIIITFCALDILILEFLPCKWQLVWNMLIKIIIIIIKNYYYYYYYYYYYQYYYYCQDPSWLGERVCLDHSSVLLCLQNGNGLEDQVEQFCPMFSTNANT